MKDSTVLSLAFSRLQWSSAEITTMWVGLTALSGKRQTFTMDQPFVQVSEQLRLVCLGQQGNGFKTAFLCNIFYMFLFKKHRLIPINQISWEALWDLTVIQTWMWSWSHRRGPEHCWKFHEHAPDVSECKRRAVPEDCTFYLILILNLTFSNRWSDYSHVSLESTGSKSGL